MRGEGRNRYRLAGRMVTGARNEDQRQKKGLMPVIVVMGSGLTGWVNLYWRLVREK